MPLSKILCAAIALALIPITLASPVALAGIVSAREDAGYAGVGLSNYQLPTHGGQSPRSLCVVLTSYIKLKYP